MIGPTWGLIDKMARYADFTNKGKITVICETDQIVQTASCYLTGACLLKAPDRQIPDLRLRDQSLQRIFHWWGIRRTRSEREDPGSP